MHQQLVDSLGFLGLIMKKVKSFSFAFMLAFIPTPVAPKTTEQMGLMVEQYVQISRPNSQMTKHTGQKSVLVHFRLSCQKIDFVPIDMCDGAVPVKWCGVRPNTYPAKISLELVDHDVLLAIGEEPASSPQKSPLGPKFTSLLHVASPYRLLTANRLGVMECYGGAMCIPI